jgi:ribosomal protein L11 methylase PrmA
MSSTPKNPNNVLPSTPITPKTRETQAGKNQEAQEDPKSWLQVKINIHPHGSEAVIGVLFAIDAQSVWEDLPDEFGRIVLKASFKEEETMRIMVDLPDALNKVKEAFDFEDHELYFEIELVPYEDYGLQARLLSHPIVISESLIISPKDTSHESIKSLIQSIRDSSPNKKYNKDNKIIYPSPRVLKLDPGAAFGSGRHPTTYMCLLLLSKLKEDTKKIPNKILDIGAGSGILSLAATLLFPNSSVQGIDNDTDTIEVALSNRDFNKLTENPNITFSDDDISILPSSSYDLILANLTLNPILSLKEQIKDKITKNNSTLILSGIIEEQAEETIEAFIALGFEAKTHLGLAEWSAIELILPEENNEPSSKIPKRKLLPLSSLDTQD